MINLHCTIIPVVILDSVITHTSAWFLDGEIHQLVKSLIPTFGLLQWVNIIKE